MGQKLTSGLQSRSGSQYLLLSVRRLGCGPAIARQGNSVGTFYTDEQILEAITALESYSPGVWEIMKKMAAIAEPDLEIYEKEQTAIVRALTVVLPKMPFVGQAEKPHEAENLLLIDVRKAIREAVDTNKVAP